jgi:dynein heavy chain, axonemal
MQRDPSLIQFNDLSTFSQKKFERARSKYLLDKLTGKLNNPDYFMQLERTMAEITGTDTDERLAEIFGKSPVKPAGQMSRVNIIGGATKTEDENDYFNMQSEQEVKPEVETHARATNKMKKTWSELDKYIELLLDSKQTDQSVFVYLNPNPNGNPYDLQVCQYNDRIEDKYYTLSAKGITLYLNETPVEFITLGDWLIERDSYNHIKELSFFKKFKRWKFLRMWRKNILSHKRAKARKMLEDKLFILDDIFRPKLLNHKAFCNEMQKMRFIDVSKALDCVTIEEFASIQ